MKFSARVKPIVMLSSGGFTLLELMIVVGLIVMMAGMAIPSFNGYFRNQSTRVARDQLVRDLRVAQSNALSNVLFEVTLPQTMYWGVKFHDSSSYYLFVSRQTAASTACNNALADSIGSRITFKDDVVVKGTSVIGRCVLFKFSDGDALSTFTQPLQMRIFIGDKNAGSGGARCSLVTLNNAGSISYRDSQPCP